jgi:SpoVK/Ycf46/Vps4 family AAA+-type ATPase
MDAQLRDIAAWMSERPATLKAAAKVAQRSDRNMRALFHGASGSGKARAAEAIAKSLNVELFRIDLAATASKYIGETEKNLDALFERAKESGAVLFFDEADALFGKRTGIRDAHDKYANQEVSYLLQRLEERIEQHPGLVILATVRKPDPDDPFIRRTRKLLPFPLNPAR